MARLIVNPGLPSAWEIQLKPGSNFIGRGFANDFKIPDGSVSGSHCEVILSNQGASIKDLGSTNGTFVGGQPIREAVLKAGQSVRLGVVEMVFQGDAAAASSPPAARSGPIKVTVVPGGKPVFTPIGTGLPQAQSTPVATIPEPPPPVVGSGTPGTSPAGAPPVPVSLVAAAPPVPRPVPVSPAVAVPPVPRPVPVAAVAAPPPAPSSGAGLVSGGPCKFHPKTPGRFFCRQCQQFFCELCVNSRLSGGQAHKFCRHCGAECVAVRVAPAAQQQAGKSFFSRLPGAFMYPLQGSGFLILLGSALVLSVLNFKFGWFLFQLMFGVIFLGYFFAFMQNIIFATVAEEKELPPLPSMANFWEDIIQPCLKLLGLMLFCFGPAISVEWMTASSEGSSLDMLVFPLEVLGLIYFPMAFLAVAILDSVAAANPLQVIPSIFKVPLEYLVTLILLGAVWGLRTLGNLVVHILFPRGLLTYSAPKLAAFFATQAFWALMSLYLLTVGIHILGLLYATKKDKLGWLSR